MNFTILLTKKIDFQKVFDVCKKSETGVGTLKILYLRRTICVF